MEIVLNGGDICPRSGLVAYIPAFGWMCDEMG